MNHSASNSSLLRTAIVGRNVSAGLLALELSKNPALQVSWHQTHQERRGLDSRQWCATSRPWALSGLDETQGIELQDTSIFLTPTRRFSLNKILNFLSSTSNSVPVHELGGVSLAIWRKIIALGFWDDPSPSLWQRDAQGKESPNANWIYKMPESLQNFPNFKITLFPKDASLKAIENVLQKTNGGSVYSGDQGVMGIQVGSLTQPHRLVHNAPFGVIEHDRVLWTSIVSALKEEASQSKSGQLKSPSLKKLGLWKNYGTFVDPDLVSGLPLFSLWIDSDRAKEFLNTGLLSSGILKKVFLIPPEYHQQSEPQSWLQIQEFVLEDERDTYSSESLHFLNDICPYLKERIKEEPAKIEHISQSDDQIIFEEPSLTLESLGAGVLFYFPGSQSASTYSNASLISALRIPKPKAVAENQATSNV